MRHRSVTAAISVFTAVALLLAAPASAQQRIVIRAGMLIDSRGGAERNSTITVEGPRITALGGGRTEQVTYDFPQATLLRLS